MRIERDIGGMADVHQQQRVAIGQRGRELGGADSAASAARVLNNELLVKSIAHAVRKNARDDVGGATGGEGHRDHHGF